MINFKPAVEGSGFHMDGYYVWCGSVVKEDCMYYMFASRWKRELGFPQGYMHGSEIVLAKTDDLSKPFEFERVIISARDKSFWDGTMAHNPCIVKTSSGYVLYYIGSSDGSKEKRSIGYATSNSVLGEWKRSEKPIALPPDANNPSVIEDGSGGVLLYYRDGDLRVSVARSESFFGKFDTVACDLFPRGRIEDMFVFKCNGCYKMICEDADGVFTGLKKGGVVFSSQDGIIWDESSAQAFYGFDIEYNSGKCLRLQRRERPVLFKDGANYYLFTAAKYGGNSVLEGGYSLNVLQEVFFDEW